MNPKVPHRLHIRGRLAATLLIAGLTCTVQAAPQHFVRVSEENRRYFELSNGEPFIPTGLNTIAPWGEDEAQSLARMQSWIDQLADNGGNYIRLWLSHDFFDIEHTRSGQYDSEKAERIDAVLEMARRRNVRIKMTVEHFRDFFSDSQPWAAKPLHHVSRGGAAKDIDDFFQGRKSRDQFKQKLGFYANRYGDDPAIFAWELWNEMDCVRGRGYMEWTTEMLAELQRLFPKNLVTQSFGSFDNDSKRPRYEQLCLMKDNDYAQVHRYLDLGASLDICKGPVDVLTADSIAELIAFESGKPIILAESGAVEPSHSGPFKLYAKDKHGMILHDVLFAPFFAGSAGTGQIWHWDHYVAANNLWFQFGRFANAVKGLDPPAEDFKPMQIKHPLLRIYALTGRNTFIAWCRDRNNSWQTELAQDRPPAVIGNAVVELPRSAKVPADAEVSFYDPWQDKWTPGQLDDGAIAPPPFVRSIVIKIQSRP